MLVPIVFIVLQLIISSAETCDSPPLIEGAIAPSLQGRQHALETEIKYRCDFGYVSKGVGPYVSKCKLDEQTQKAEWTDPELVCIPRSCGDPGYVVNGRRIGNVFTFPNKVNFECEEGYKMKGFAARYCQPSGEWSGRLPTCEEIFCDPPSNPENGRVIYSSLEYGTELQYECNKGWKLNNYQTRYCSGSGTWSNNEPECIEVRCDVPQAPDHGQMKLENDLKVGSLALYSCDDDKSLVGSSISKCSNDGQWTFPPPKCVDQCIIPVVKNGKVGRFETKRYGTRYYRQFVEFHAEEKINPGETITLLCKDGFIPKERSKATSESTSEQQVTCEYGSWSNSLECISASCDGEPPSIENGYPVVNKRTHMHVIYYNCYAPYQKIQTGRVECFHGTWRGNTPKCGFKNRCTTDQLDHPGLIKPKEEFINNGQTLEVSCLEGYVVTNKERSIQCNEGLWDVPNNPCTEVPCYAEDLEYPGLIIPKKESFRHGEDFMISCAEDYTVTSRRRIRCNKGQWEVHNNPCTDNRCNTHKIQYPGLIKPTEQFFRSGQNFDVSCAEGYKAGRKRRIYCNNAEWDVSFNPCTEVPCNTDELDYPGLIKPKGETFKNGETFLISCADEYTFTGRARIIRCNKGKWNISDSPCTEDSKLPPTKFSEDEYVDRKEDTEPDVFENKDGSEDSSFSSTEFPENKPVDKTEKKDGTHVVFDNEGKSENVTCGPPPSMEGAISPRLQSSQHALGTQVRYRCNPGYVSKGSRRFQSVCTLDNKTQKAIWTNPNIECVPRSCGDPGFVIHGRRIGNLLTFPNQVEFRCEEGYILNGLAFRDCQDDGEWSGELPICEEIRCAEPSNPENGRVIYSSLEYGAELQYECNDGFILDGDQTRSCIENATWSNNDPVCIEVNCDKSQAPEYGSVQFTGLRLDSLALYSCDDGKFLVGKSISKCIEGGQWADPPPKCVDKCIIPDVENGRTGQYTGMTTRQRNNFVEFQVGHGINFDETITLLCNAGFIIVKDYQKGEAHDSEQEVRCENGKWSTSLECKPGSCQKEPPSIENGFPVIKERSHMDVISYNCDNGFGKLRSGRVECFYGEWRGSTPECGNKNARTTANPTTMSARLTSVTYRTSTEEPQNPGVREDCFCTFAPERMHHFHNMQTPDYGSMVRKGETAMFRCKDSRRMLLYWQNGLYVLGSANLICEKCRTWLLRDVPTCTPLVEGQPFIILNDKMKLVPGGIVKIQENENLRIQCSTIYRHNAVPYPVWTSPVSQRVVSNGHTFEGGQQLSVYISIDRFTTRLSGEYRCRVNTFQYVYTTVMTLKMSEPGCRTLDERSNFRINYSDGTKVNSIASYFCKRSSQGIAGPTIRKCLENGEWSGNEPECVDIACPRISYSEDFYVLYSYQQHVGSRATFQCIHPRVLVGNPVLLCLGNGTWNDTQPLCSKPEVRCPELDEKDIFIITYHGDRKVNSDAYYVCKDPTWETSGSNVRNCQANKKWSGIEPKCIARECQIEDLITALPKGVIPNENDITGEAMAVGEELRLLCETKKNILIGSRTARCNQVRAWEFGNPQCILGCHLSDRSSSSTLIINSVKDYYRFGDSIQLSCPDGQELTEEIETVMCMGGQWSDPLPDCKNVKD